MLDPAPVRPAAPWILLPLGAEDLHEYTPVGLIHLHPAMQPENLQELQGFQPVEH